MDAALAGRGATHARSMVAASRYRYFGAIRFGLSLMVLAQHIWTSIPGHATIDAVRPLELGSTAVLVFFALSGFIIAEAAESHYADRPVAFIVNRTLRLVPQYIAAVSVFMAVCAVLSQWFPLISIHNERPIVAGAFSIGGVIANYLSIVPGVNIDDSQHFIFLPYVWAVRIEFEFYACVFLILMIKKATKARNLGLLFIVAFIIMSAYYIHLQKYGLHNKLTYLPFFALGMSAFYCLAGSKAGIVPLLLSAIAVVWSFWLDGGPAVDVRLAILLLLLALCGAGAMRAGTHRQRDADVAMGELSYPIYLNHGFVGTMFHSLGPAQSAFAAVCASGASVLFAMLMSRLIEPQLKRVRDHVRGRAVS